MKRKAVITWLKSVRNDYNKEEIDLLIIDFKKQFPKKEKKEAPAFTFQSVIPSLPKGVTLTIKDKLGDSACLSNDCFTWCIIYIKGKAIGEIGAYVECDATIQFEEFHYDSDFGSDMNDTFEDALSNILDRTK